MYYHYLFSTHTDTFYSLTITFFTVAKHCSNNSQHYRKSHYQAGNAHELLWLCILLSRIAETMDIQLVLDYGMYLTNRFWAFSAQNLTHKILAYCEFFFLVKKVNKNNTDTSSCIYIRLKLSCYTFSKLVWMCFVIVQI